MYRRVIFLLFLPLISIMPGQGKLYTMEPLIVTASKIPTTVLGTSRNILVIEEEEIRLSPAGGVEDLLKYVLGIEINQRGPEGVQSDVSIAGGTFEQNLILIDGVKVNDPQTAHHNFNLPIQTEYIERIEILKGPGARLYGAGAFSGVINIITKKGEVKGIKIKAMAGDYKLLEGSLSISQPLGISNNYISVSGRHSDGYRYNTDFDIWNIFLKSTAEYKKIKGNISLGHNYKDFGASYFYSDVYPNQREQTRTAFLNLGLDFGKINTEFFLRRHEDDFMLDYEDPWFYRNYHRTYSCGLTLQSSISSVAGITAGGLEVAKERIESASLGYHPRTKSSFFFEHRLPTVKNLCIVFGSSLIYYSDWDWYFCPGADLGFKINDQTYLYTSIESAFRVPSYTELYLVSPVNVGDSSLQPERAVSFEIGIKKIRGSILTNINAFVRSEKNIIDWVRATSLEPWMAANVGEMTVKGVDLNITYKPIVRMYKKFPIPSINLGYTFFRLDRPESPLQSKYLLSHPEHKFTLSVDYDLSSNIKQVWKGRYEILPDDEKNLIFDTGISLEIKNAELFIHLTNLLNTEYKQAEWIPMPGRWAKAGIRVEI